MDTTTAGRDWLEMRLAHFDVTKLPPKHRKADPDALWTVADLADPHWANRKPAAKTAPEFDGQFDLFSEAGQ
jgi:hypothetical protein